MAGQQLLVSGKIYHKQHLISFSCKDYSTVFVFSQVEFKKALFWYFMFFNSVTLIAVPRSHFCLNEIHQPQ